MCGYILPENETSYFTSNLNNGGIIAKVQGGRIGCFGSFEVCYCDGG